MHKHSSDFGGSIEISCCECGKRFQKENDLINHIKIHENNLDSCYFCPWKGIFGRHNWRTHVARHANAKGHLKCNFCEKRFFNRSRRAEHEELHEKIVDRYKCLNCTYVSHSKTMMGKHKPVCPNKN